MSSATKTLSQKVNDMHNAMHAKMHDDMHDKMHDDMHDAMHTKMHDDMHDKTRDDEMDPKFDFSRFANNGDNEQELSCLACGAPYADKDDVNFCEECGANLVVQPAIRAELHEKMFARMKELCGQIEAEKELIDELENCDDDPSVCPICGEEKDHDEDQFCWRCEYDGENHDDD